MKLEVLPQPGALTLLKSNGTRFWTSLTTRLGSMHPAADTGTLLSFVTTLPARPASIITWRESSVSSSSFHELHRRVRL
jgi:hypothetical protein